MTTSRSRYSTAPTYGMQRRPAPKKQAEPKAVPPPPVMPQPPYGQPAMQGYVQQPVMPMMPQAAPAQVVYPPQQPGYMPPQPGYGHGAAPAQGGYPPQRQPYVPVQPMPYPPQQPYPPQPVPQEYTIRVKGPVHDQWLQILLLAVLPVLFILTLFISVFWLKIAFVGAAVICLIGMWMQGAFVPSARATLTLVYSALILACAVSLITSMAPRDTSTLARGGNAGNSGVSSPASGSGAQGTGQTGGDNQQQQQQQAQVPTPTPPPQASGENSDAWQRLQQFFDFWITNNTQGMLSLVSPNWKSAQDKPDMALFLALSNRIPLDYQFEKVSGSDADSSRTVTMTATIDKLNGRDPVKIRYQIVMLRIGEDWFVDPNTLKSNEPVATATPDPGTGSGTSAGSGNTTAATAPPATASPNLKLYYNKKGNGTYYHLDSECKSINSKWFPLTSFYYKDLNKTTLKNLRPCPDCKPPDRK